MRSAVEERIEDHNSGSLEEGHVVGDVISCHVSVEN